jgi:serine phosphatase RsbU (regulator of sigma subunit)
LALRLLSPVDDHLRELEYANRGHHAPLLLRADGSIETLASTSTVISLFPEWHCATRHITLAPGDLLVKHADGVRRLLMPPATSSA